MTPDLQTEEEKPDKMWVLCRVGTTGILSHNTHGPVHILRDCTKRSTRPENDCERIQAF